MFRVEVRGLDLDLYAKYYAPIPRRCHIDPVGTRVWGSLRPVVLLRLCYPWWYHCGNQSLVLISYGTTGGAPSPRRHTRSVMTPVVGL